MGNYREPQSANEAALQNILGEQNELREPQSVTEFYLKEILEKGGGGGTVVIDLTDDEITAINRAFQTWLMSALQSPNTMVYHTERIDLPTMATAFNRMAAGDNIAINLPLGGIPMQSRPTVVQTANMNIGTHSLIPNLPIGGGAHASGMVDLMANDELIEIVGLISVS